MTTKKTQKTQTAVSFTDQIRAALNHYDDPEWLGLESPLAAPYFLGHVLQNGANAQARGNALRHALQLAAAQLWSGPLPANKADLETAVHEERQQRGNKSTKYRFLLLELRYFRQYFRTNETPTADNDIAMCDYLSISRASYFNHLKVAQTALGEALLNQLQPTLHLEQPVVQEPNLIGRNALLTQCLTDLQSGQSVALSGMGGSGKTTLAAVIAQEWQHPVFWYTIRPSLNDQIESLIFSLGAFLHQQGASSLWQQLTAEGGTIDNYDLALAAAKNDLTELTLPLICVDEIDNLYREDDIIQTNHVQIREFLDSLRQSAQLLVIGQRHVLYLDKHYQLSNFTLPQQIAFFAQKEVQLTLPEQQQLYEYSDGNPRLLHLCLALIKIKMPLATILADWHKTSALQALWQQLWQRLDSGEQLTLQQIAVFRGSVPADGWGDAGNYLQRLQARHLIQSDQRGGITLLPVFRRLLLADWQRFPATEREDYHLLAADMRLVRGEYTAVAYHLVQAKEESTAIQLWYPHRHLEIRRGFAMIAQNIFQQISSRHLPQAEQQVLALIRADLLRLTGRIAEGLQEIKTTKWSKSSELTLRAEVLRGDFLNALGYPHQALTRYEDGIAVTARLLNRLVSFRYHRGSVFIQQKILDDAQQELLRAQHDTAYLQGMIFDEQGAYADAITAYQEAITFAEQIEYALGLAQTHRALVNIYGRSAQLNKVIKHATSAAAIFEQLGDKLNQERLNSSVAAAYFQAGKFSEVIELAEPTVAYFESIGIQYWMAVTASTLAEAYFEVGEFEKAHQTAHKVLRLEEMQTHPYALYTLGLLSKNEHNWEQAQAYFQQSQQTAHENGDRFMEAYAWRALGEALSALDKRERAMKALQTAVSLFKSLDLTHEQEASQQLLQTIK